MLIRRNISDGDLAFFTTWCPAGTGIQALVAVEGFFARLTNRRLKRGVFHSLVDLQAAINRFLAEHNESPKPEVAGFVRTADHVL